MTKIAVIGTRSINPRDPKIDFSYRVARRNAERFKTAGVIARTGAEHEAAMLCAAILDHFAEGHAAAIIAGRVDADQFPTSYLPELGVCDAERAAIMREHDLL